MYFSAERVGVGGMEVEEKEVCVCEGGFGVSGWHSHLSSSFACGDGIIALTTRGYPLSKKGKKSHIRVDRLLRCTLGAITPIPLPPSRHPTPIPHAPPKQLSRWVSRVMKFKGEIQLRIWVMSYDLKSVRSHLGKSWKSHPSHTPSSSVFTTMECGV